MTVMELMSVLEEFDGTEIIAVAPAPGDRRDIRIANGQVYGTLTNLDEEDLEGIEPGQYNIVTIEY